MTETFPVSSEADLRATLDTFPWRAVEEAVDVLSALRGGVGDVYVAGNGGSAATASHFAADLEKYCSPDAGTAIRSTCLNDNATLLTALVNDVGWDRLYSYQLDRRLRPADVLVLFSVHGGDGRESAGPWSQNLVVAARRAREAGIPVIGFTGFDGGYLAQVSTVSVHVSSRSTPVVEGWHSLAAHLVVERLARRLALHGEDILH